MELVFFLRYLWEIQMEMVHKQLEIGFNCVREGRTQETDMGVFVQ